MKDNQIGSTPINTVTIAKPSLFMILNICIAAATFLAFALLCVSMYFTGFRLATIVSSILDIVLFILCIKDAYKNYVELKATELHIASMLYYILNNKEDKHDDDNIKE